MRSYVDAVDQSGMITYWERDADGVLYKGKEPSSNYTYGYMISNNSSETGMKSLYGDPVKRVSFGNGYEMRQASQGRTDFYESDVPAVIRFLMDNYPDSNITKLNTLYYDIEVGFDLNEGKGFPTPANPFGDINLIQCFHTGKEEYCIFLSSDLYGRVELEDKHYPVRLVWCDSERDFLASFSEYIEDIDVMTAWYGAMFDLNYIMERAMKLFGKDKALSLLCRDGFNATRRDFVNEFGEDAWTWQLVGRKHIDLLELYKKFVPSEQKSFKLDNIAEAELGIRKVEVDDGDLGELYRRNPQKFCEYGLHDARILKQLDDKLKMITLADVIAKMSFVTIPDVLGSVKPIECALINYAHKKGIVLPKKKDNEKEDFPGAIVYDTINGRHDWGFTQDLTGLYPHTMMMLGLSPETMILQCRGGFDDYVGIMTGSDETLTVDDVYGGSTNDTFVLTGKEMLEIVKDNGYVVASSGTIFNGSMGILSEFTQQIVNRRKEYQRIMKQSEDENVAKMYDMYQKVMKIFGNSIYGASGEASFRLYDIRLSSSITMTARMISKHNAVKPNQVINELLEAA